MADDEAQSSDEDALRVKLEYVSEALERKRQAVADYERALRELTLGEDDISTITINVRPASSILLGNQTLISLASPDIVMLDSDPTDPVSADSDGPQIM